MNRKEIKEIAVGVGFLLPNIIGFLSFTVIPLLMSIYMAFTDWNLEMHNFFRFEKISFVGFDNFVKLFREPDFMQYLGNTFFLMMGIPFGVGGSLAAALLLNKDFKGGRGNRVWITVFLTAVLTVSSALLVLCGMAQSAMVILLVSLAGAIFVFGSLGGQGVYRTLFYFPYFTAGVATFILWKKLYNPLTGPINNFLRPILDALTPVAVLVQPVCPLIGWLLLAGAGAIFVVMLRRKYILWRDGEAGNASLFLGMVFTSLPLLLSFLWIAPAWGNVLAAMLLAVGWGWILYRFFTVKRKYRCVTDKGIGDSAIIDGALMIVALILIGLCNVFWDLPAYLGEGNVLEPPLWLSDYYWAKPSIMIMGFWGAIGSNNMLLYLAGLSGVPQELYEAADIDGASSWQRFWHITWPQLANVTFFIMVMAVIGGLQGGFEMARTMTQGGPAGSTTTLAYYIYTQGFATGRLGYASAVSWLLFLLVFTVTIFNWKFGNRYTNE